MEVTVSLLALCLSMLSICPLNGQLMNRCMTSCVCQGHVAKCDCEANKPTSGDPIDSITILPMSLTVIPTELIIQNCKQVKFYPWTMYSKKSLRKVEITNVQDLQIEANAFFETKHAHSIVIRHTTIPKLVSDSLAHIDGIHKIELDNVVINIIEQNAFAGIVNVSHFRILNSKIGIANSLSFPNSTQYVENFAFDNTTFGSLEFGSIQIKHVGNITFRHLAIDKWHSKAFSPDSVRHINVRYSNISELHEKAFSCENVDVLQVLHNRITELYPNAFGQIKNVNNFEFSSNVIHEVKRGVLFGYDRDFVQQATIVDNKFDCNAALCWLMRDEQQVYVNATILENSVCHSPSLYAGKMLSTVFSLHDDEDFCKDDSEGSGAGFDLPLHKNDDFTITIQNDTTETNTVSISQSTSNPVHGRPNTSQSCRPRFSALLTFFILCVTIACV